MLLCSVLVCNCDGFILAKECCVIDVIPESLEDDSNKFDPGVIIRDDNAVTDNSIDEVSSNNQDTDECIIEGKTKAIALKETAVLNSASINDYSFDTIKQYEAFYVDKEVDGFYHVVSDWDYYVSSEDVIVGDELADWLKMSNQYDQEVQVVSQTAELRIPESRTPIAVVEQDSLFRVIENQRYNVKVMYDEQECFLAKSDVKFIYRIPEHQFSESAEALFASIAELTKSANSLLEKIREESSVSSRREAIVEEALKYVGNPYVWGGNNPNVGADCSGFTKYVYNQFGISISRTSYTQCNEGKAVTSASELRPGDLVFYYNNEKGRIGHVAMYIGDGKMVEAKGAKYGIVISDFDWDKVYCARNILGD